MILSDLFAFDEKFFGSLQDLLAEEDLGHSCVSRCPVEGSLGKCCHYWPFLPNFVLGGILEKSPELWERLKLSKLSLLGALPPLDYRESFDRQGGHQVGASNSETLCPYFKKGQCSIWDFRGSVCQGFYCQSKKSGFWKSYQNFFFDIELGLAQLVGIYMGKSLNEMEKGIHYLNQEIQSIALGARDPEEDWEVFYKECLAIYSSHKEELFKLVLEEHRASLFEMKKEAESLSKGSLKAPL